MNLLNWASAVRYVLIVDGLLLLARRLR